MTEDFVAPHLKAMRPLLKGLEQYFDPSFRGLDKLDLTRPALFVGNHTIYGLLDIPLMVNQIYQQHGVYLRSLGDHAHFLFPGWHQMLKAGGMVDGTPENCRKLMQAGESILVFPGGSREVMRRKGDDYQLFWKSRTGFARLAIEQGYDIIPFASVGPNECFDIRLDANDFLKKPWVSKTIQHLKLQKIMRDGDVFLPIAGGLLGMPVPKPQKFYFSFAERIKAQNFIDHPDSALQLRIQVEDAVQEQIRVLKQLRDYEKSNHWSWLRKKLTE